MTVVPRGGVVEWLALRRASGGRMARTHGGYVDAGRPIPADLAELLPALAAAGHVALAPTDAWGVSRVSLTVPSGVKRLAELAETHDPQRRPAPAGRPAPRWALSTFDDRVHAVTPNGSRPAGQHVGLCGLVLTASATMLPSPDGSRPCGTCEVIAAIEAGR